MIEQTNLHIVAKTEKEGIKEGRDDGKKRQIGVTSVQKQRYLKGVPAPSPNSEMSFETIAAHLVFTTRTTLISVPSVRPILNG